MSPLLLIEELLATGIMPTFPDDSIPSDSTWTIEHVIKRLKRSLNSNTFSLDQAVLLRQCLRLIPDTQKIITPYIHDSIKDFLPKVGIIHDLSGLVTAIPFTPDWLDEYPHPVVDVVANNQLITSSEAIPSEPWLVRGLGRTSWRSQAQKELAWLALNSELNSTVLIGLPTGAGKSLIFQACSCFEDGMTIIVVPTVALAIDQLASVLNMPFSESVNPRLYSSDEDSQSVLDEVKNNRCKMLITSPEAIVSGRLRPIIENKIVEGWLHRLVIDEAHIIESWGASFRIEFQLLGSLIRNWRKRSPNGIRVLLLSATFMPDTPKVLRNLFADSSSKWDEFIVQRLRPEIHYFSTNGTVSPSNQINYLIESLARLPRPLIFYVTEINDAEKWYSELQSRGYRRIERFHGDTKPNKRQEIMSKWRDDQLDIIIATSAFGLGVDKSDVRAVVHACYPENIDRFYQEVGRGGRDGAASISLLIPTDRDRHVGSNMGPVLLTDPVKILGRWDAMWSGKKSTEGNADVYKIPLQVGAGYRIGSGFNQDEAPWNKRLLLLMERSGLIRIEGMIREINIESLESVEWALILPIKSTLELQSNLDKLLEGPRSQELSLIKRSTGLLNKFLNRESPACRIFREHYGKNTYLACGSCVLCRSGTSIPSRPSNLTFTSGAHKSSPQVDIIDAGNFSDAHVRGKIMQALRMVLRSKCVQRIVTPIESWTRTYELISRVDDGSGVLYRIDVASKANAKLVHENENVIIFHFSKDEEKILEKYNYHGRRVSHWYLGNQLHGDWPYMHEFNSRLFIGNDAIDRWLAVIGS